jgi:hypothetical protein
MSIQSQSPELSKLALLQYNVNKSRDKVMIGLFQDPRLVGYDILAIQEPWRNSYNSQGYNPSPSLFHLVEKASERARTAIYINRRIPLSCWDEIYKEEDLITIRLTIPGDEDRDRNRKIYIHSIYLPPPNSHSERQTPQVLHELQEQLRYSGEHIILGDLNLHHPLWNSPSYPWHHHLADELLDIVSDIGASLVTPKGLPTRDCQRGTHHEQTTIDLAFTTIEAIEYCRIAETLEQGSDHLPIELGVLIPEPISRSQKPPRLHWKELNLEILLSTLDKETLGLESIGPRSQQEIDIYITTLLQGLRKAITAAVPIKKSSRYNKSYWNIDCSIAVKTTRLYRRLFTRNPT